MVNTLRPPPEVIASWPPPNYIDPEERGPGLVYCAIILASVGVLTVSARTYSRVFITRAPGIDDFLIVLGMLLGLALTVLVCIGNLRYHSGRHIWDIVPGSAADHRLNIWVSQWCYLTSTTCIKISVLLFYRRLSVTFSRGFWWATWIGIWYNILQTLAFCCALLLLCRPVAAYWLSFDRTWLLTHQDRFTCAPEGLSLTLSAVVSVVGDFYAAVLPSVLILGLNMTPRKKWAVGALFAVGYVVVGLGIGRCIVLNRVVMRDFDYTWTLWEMWVWSLCELWIGLVAASAPALKPFLKRFLVDPLSSAISGGMEGVGGRSTAEEGRESSGLGRRGKRTTQVVPLGVATRRPVRSWNWLSPLIGSPLSPRGNKPRERVLDDSASTSQLKSHDDGGPDLEMQRRHTNSPGPGVGSAGSSPDLDRGVPMRTYQYTSNADVEAVPTTIDSRLAGDAHQAGLTAKNDMATHEASCWSPASEGIGRALGEPGEAVRDGDSDLEWHGRERERRLSNRRMKWDWG